MTDLWISDDQRIMLLNDDCVNFLEWIHMNSRKADLIYADMIYDDFDFNRWLPMCWEVLANTGSIFVQTDYRSVAELKSYLDTLFGKNRFINWIIWPYDWGGRPKRAFGRKHDDILWYAKTANYKFFPTAIEIPKKTAGTAFDAKGTGKKLPTDVWNDIGNFHTMASERISGVNWQKPERLVQRIVLATTELGDLVLDPYMGSGTTAAVCWKLARCCWGSEIEKSIWDASVDRLDKLQKETIMEIVY